MKNGHAFTKGDLEDVFTNIYNKGYWEDNKSLRKENLKVSKLDLMSQIDEFVSWRGLTHSDSIEDLMNALSESLFD